MPRRKSRAAAPKTKGAPAPNAFELLRSKLDVPTPRPGLVERTALVDRLSRTRDGRFVSLVAPIGYGKTTALAQWAKRDSRPFAWVSLDHRDNDPVTLLTYIAEALNFDGSIGSRVFKALSAAGDSVWVSALPQLGSALASHDPVVLVLDDAHELEDQRCLDALGALAQHVPAGSELVLSARTEPLVGLATMRAGGQLLEVGTAALALNDVEARALLAAAGVELTPAEADALNARAEGWAAGLYFAAMALGNEESSLASFGGDDRFVTDYLRAEELARTTPDETMFLCRSAVLDRMSGPLCDAVLERSDSAEMLERLEGHNLFVVALDHNRTWFRYHHLFREMLQAELERREPGLVQQLNQRAASWCAANDRPEEAIDYLTAAGDIDGLAKLVVGSVLPYFRTGRVATVERWLVAFDDQQLLERYPDVAVMGAWVHALRGRPDAAERWALAAEAADQTSVMPDGSSLAAWVATLRALLCRGGIEQMRADAELALSGLTPASPWRPGAMVLRGIAVMLGGDADRAERLLTEAAEGAVGGGAVWAGVTARSELALLATERGDLEAAEAHLELAGAIVEDAAGDYVLSAIRLAATARLAVAEGKGTRARQALASAQLLRPAMTHAMAWFSVRVLVELAKAHLALGDPRGAATLSREAHRLLGRRPRLGTLAADAASVRARLGTTPDATSGWASTLTAAELRLLPLLTTHLSFREIAERLFVSRNTVKTQAISVYRKLDASSRSEAIDRAVELGLVDAAPGAARAADFTRSG